MGIIPGLHRFVIRFQIKFRLHRNRSGLGLRSTVKTGRVG
jgi:hypothetical protein